MKTIIPVFLVLCCLSCNTQPEISKEKYLQELKDWKIKRIERLKMENGWLNLAGLYWLEEGMNLIGSDSANDLIFPENAPGFCGTIVKNRDSLYFRYVNNKLIRINGEIKDGARLVPDSNGEPTLMETGNLRWYIIKRDTLYGIRLRDLEHPRINKLDHIPAFEPDLSWRKVAHFTPYEQADTLRVPTVAGVDEINLVPGKLEFRHEGKKYELLPFVSGKGLFLIIGDKTSAFETYPAGRFMYAEAPDTNNTVILDFNKAYNPPCAFSAFATCPLPPPENRLDIRIAAGEKAVHMD